MRSGWMILLVAVAYAIAPTASADDAQVQEQLKQMQERLMLLEDKLTNTTDQLAERQHRQRRYRGRCWLRRPGRSVQPAEPGRPGLLLRPAVVRARAPGQPRAALGLPRRHPARKDRGPARRRPHRRWRLRPLLQLALGSGHLRPSGEHPVPGRHPEGRRHQADARQVGDPDRLRSRPGALQPQHLAQHPLVHVPARGSPGLPDVAHRGSALPLPGFRGRARLGLRRGERLLHG